MWTPTCATPSRPTSTGCRTSSPPPTRSSRRSGPPTCRPADAVVGVARAAGAHRVAPTTYADVPWNGPWYAARGSTPVTDPGSELTTLAAREAALGLEVHDRRVLMGRTP